MSLTSQLSNDFDAAVRRRGADYYRTGRVRIDSAHPSCVVATVQGSGKSPYTVELERQDAHLIASCTCRYFDREPCKHVWAVILAASSRGLLEGNGGNRRVQLLPSFDRDEDRLFSEDTDDFDRDEARDREWEELLWDSEDVPRHRQPVRARAGAPGRSRSRKGSPKNEVPSWRKQLARLHSGGGSETQADTWPSTRELLYVIDVQKTQEERELQIEVCFRDLKMEGGWSKPKGQYLRREWLEQLPELSDRKILALLSGATAYHPNASYFPGGYDGSLTLPFRYRLREAQALWLLPEMCQSGRCYLRLAEEEAQEREESSVKWEGPEPFRLELTVEATADRGHYELTGALRRGERTLSLSSVVLASAGVLFTREVAVPYEPPSARQWIALLREQGPLRVPAAQADDFLTELLGQPELPALFLAEELRYEEIAVKPQPHLLVKPAGGRSEHLRGELFFDYDGVLAARGQPGQALVHGSRRRMLIREPATERAAVERLQRLGWRWHVPNHLEPEAGLELHPRHLLRVVRELTLDGWHVQAQGQLFRAPGRIHIQVSSGIDWFELHGQVQFGETQTSLPELLAALRHGVSTVKLDDGTVGMLPDEWLKKYGLLAGIGTSHEGHLRFRRSQVALLDVLLDEHPQAQCDELFVRAREELKCFSGIQPAEPPAGFCGQLRPYQQEGLGWMHFLRHFGFGGCLADDMGLGKTVQVLALLESRRELRSQLRGLGPALIVVPKSLIFNWKQEAARFAPRLRVLDHTGQLRQKGSEHVADYDVVLTTYGTLRNDVVDFKDVRFDYVILDESQAIKNADSVSAKAVRLLKADHRLALSGTPIENHLGELWSLFEFLNPGMLGTASVLQLTRGAERNPDHETRKLLARALRPFLLRRTKDQVIQDLPPKVEQTLYCELEGRQRRLYDELREHYRQGLMSRIEREGLGRSKIQILEALLRLRQAALHPGLLDNERRGEPSAKLDILVPRLKEVIEEGHKTLVFSQFTGMLSILREHLKSEGLTFEYLDGGTVDRQARVERFQKDPGCRLFLISLKAGGVGLNLTAAQYVFLLDPWWNPAIEAQAIDRAHRIGQNEQVFAYRLIARDTVEEKVLELQSTKRELADAILSEDNSLIRDLGKEDLQLLLS